MGWVWLHRSLGAVRNEHEIVRFNDALNNIPVPSRRVRLMLEEIRSAQVFMAVPQDETQAGCAKNKTRNQETSVRV